MVVQMQQTLLTLEDNTSLENCSTYLEEFYEVDCFREPKVQAKKPAYARKTSNITNVEAVKKMKEIAKE